MRVLNDGNLNVRKSVLILALAVKTPLLDCLVLLDTWRHTRSSAVFLLLAWPWLLLCTSSVWVIAIYCVHKTRIDCMCLYKMCKYSTFFIIENGGCIIFLQCCFNCWWTNNVLCRFCYNTLIYICSIHLQMLGWSTRSLIYCCFWAWCILKMQFLLRGLSSIHMALKWKR